MKELLKNLFFMKGISNEWCYVRVDNEVVSGLTWPSAHSAKGFIVITKVYTPGVNFINVLQAAFTRSDPESAKKTVKLPVFFGLCWWNQAQESISPTLYEQLFVKRAFLCLKVFFWIKNEYWCKSCLSNDVDDYQLTFSAELGNPAP